MKYTLSSSQHAGRSSGNGLSNTVWRSLFIKKITLTRSWFLTTILLFLLLTDAFCTGGLKFQGSEKPINQRTSYDVFGEEVAEFSGTFDLAFDLSLYPTTTFGYIIRIKNRDSNRVYNLFYDGQGDNVIFKFNEEGTHSLIVANLTKEDLHNKPWFPVRISFDLKNDSISLTVRDKRFTAHNEGLPDRYRPVVVFGRSDHFIDVPSFAIKDLVAGSQNQFHFALNEISGTAVHDSEGRSIGTVTNPEWLMNDSYHWRFKTSFKSASVAGANYDPIKNEIYYFNKDSIHVYNVRSGAYSVTTFRRQAPLQIILGTNFIVPAERKLYVYEVYYAEDRENDGPNVAALNLDTYEWESRGRVRLPRQLHHHASHFDSTQGRYILFGGFGNMHYSKEFYAYDLKTDTWQHFDSLKGDLISPRYFSSMGYSPSERSLYVFGGMGNESGEQIVGRRYYYDLHKLDLETNKMTKLWEIEWKKDNVVPVRGMVLLDDSSFYTLCYPEHFSESFLRLYRFSLKDGSYEIMGDSIPIQSDKITTNANLYFDRGRNNLYAVVQEFDDDISSDLKVYSLSFPPITSDQLAEYKNPRNDFPIASTVLILLMIGGAGYYFYHRMELRREEKAKAAALTAANAISEVKTRPNSINLFGDFTLHDRNNRDITYMFSAQLKQAFCLILQFSTTEGGIASQRFSSILWPDKPADKVKNSRGVTINHLRKVLSELDGVELVFDKGFFKLEYSTPFYCDYIRCMEIVSSPDIADHRTELVEILARGRFLQLFDHPLFDSFKEEVEKKLEPVLLLEIERSFEAEQYPITIELSKALFNIDPLNDVALNFQIKAMQRLKLNDEARLRYQAFVVEYKKAMGTEYPHPYVKA